MILPDISTLAEPFGIYRLAPNAPLASELQDAPMTFVSRTDEELSVVCPIPLAERSGLAAATAADCKSAPWSCIKVAGPIDFAVVGLLARISAALAAADISLFALSTFDTDYVLVPSAQLANAEAELNRAGFASA